MDEQDSRESRLAKMASKRLADSDAAEMRLVNERYWDAVKEARAEKAKFIDRCLMEVRERDSPSAPSLYDNEKHRDELAQAFEHLYDTSLESWRYHHSKGAGDQEFREGVFFDMLVGNLHDKAGEILDKLHSSGTKYELKWRRDAMNERVARVKDEGAKKLEEKKFYNWRKAFFADILFEVAINNVADYLKMPEYAKDPVQRLLRTGAAREETPEGFGRREEEYEKGLKMPYRRYLLHNSDVIHAVNRMHKTIAPEDRPFPKPLPQYARLGRNKSLNPSLDNFRKPK